METINVRYRALIKALATLKKSLDKIESKQYADYEEIRDSLIQRFEYCSDIFWKVIKDIIVIKFNLSEVIARPKAVYKEAKDLGALTDSEYKICLSMVESRNITSHAYNEAVADRVSEEIPEYYAVMFNILERYKQIFY